MRASERMVEVLRQDNSALMDENTALIIALRAVEWLPGDYGTSMQNSVYCPSCSIFHDRDSTLKTHYKHCKIGKALDLLKKPLPSTLKKKRDSTSH